VAHDGDGFFDEEATSAGELTQFLGESVTLIQSMNGENLALAGRFVFVLVWGLTLMFVFGDPLICVVVLAAPPVMVVSMSLQIVLFSGGAVGDHASDDEPGTVADGKRIKTAGALIGEVVLGIRTVASFTAEHRLYEDYCTVVTAAFMRARRRNLPIAFVTGFAKGSMMMLFGAVFEFDMWRINSQTDDTFGGSVANTTTESCASPISFSAADGLFIPLMVREALPTPLSSYLFPTPPPLAPLSPYPASSASGIVQEMPLTPFASHFSPPGRCPLSHPSGPPFPPQISCDSFSSSPWQPLLSHLTASRTSQPLPPFSSQVMFSARTPHLSSPPLRSCL
jgi:hypothetical protein